MKKGFHHPHEYLDFHTERKSTCHSVHLHRLEVGGYLSLCAVVLRSREDYPSDIMVDRKKTQEIMLYENKFASPEYVDDFSEVLRRPDEPVATRVSIFQTICTVNRLYFSRYFFAVTGLFLLLPG